MIFKKKKNVKAQVLIEFTFSMIFALLMIFATMMIFRWAGRDIAERRKSHDRVLQHPDARTAIDPFFHRPVDMGAVFDD